MKKLRAFQRFLKDCLNSLLTCFPTLNMAKKIHKYLRKTRRLFERTKVVNDSYNTVFPLSNYKKKQKNSNLFSLYPNNTPYLDLNKKIYQKIE